MKLLHTSDWHLGQNFLFRQRIGEHEKFLSWLRKIIEKELIDLLVVAGDIFDTATPPSYALEMYYQFLASLHNTSCRDVIIISGNHDSASVLNAPRNVLKALNVHVVASVTERIDDEILFIEGSDGSINCVVCAVPFLREADIRRSVPGESWEDKSKAVTEGLQSHYTLVASKAMELMENKSLQNLPLIGTGHLFASGGKTGEGDHIREIHVGNMEKFNASQMPQEFDYIALGHLHKAQKAGGKSHIRYSGSPIPLSFGEAEYEKFVLKVDFNSKVPAPVITPIQVPLFQKLVRIKGSLEEIIEQLKSFPDEGNEEIWVEILVTKGWEPLADETIRKAAANTSLKLFAIKKKHIKLKNEKNQPLLENLNHYSCSDIFKKRLEIEDGLDNRQKKDLLMAFNEIESIVRQDKKGTGLQ